MEVPWWQAVLVSPLGQKGVTIDPQKLGPLRVAEGTKSEKRDEGSLKFEVRMLKFDRKTGKPIADNRARLLPLPWLLP